MAALPEKLFPLALTMVVTPAAEPCASSGLIASARLCGRSSKEKSVIRPAGIVDESEQRRAAAN